MIKNFVYDGQVLHRKNNCDEINFHSIINNKGPDAFLLAGTSGQPSKRGEVLTADCFLFRWKLINHCRYLRKKSAIEKIAQVVFPVPNDDERTYAYADKDIPILGRFDQCLWKWKHVFQDILQCIEVGGEAIGQYSNGISVYQMYVSRFNSALSYVCTYPDSPVYQMYVSRFTSVSNVRIQAHHSPVHNVYFVKYIFPHNRTSSHLS